MPTHDTPERWLPVVGWEGCYEVSSLGRVRNVRETRPRPAGYVLKGSLNVWGYPYVTLACNGTHKGFQIHALVAYAFLGPRATGMEINHRNGQKTDNSVGNLEYLTKTEHVSWGMQLGQVSRGEDNGQSKLTESEVREIRSLRGKVRQVDLAARFGVSQVLIGIVQRGDGWKHVPLEGPVAPVVRGVLTDDEVREIRRLRGVEEQAALGARFGLCQSDISAIQLGKTYRHVPLDAPVAPQRGPRGSLSDDEVREIRVLRGVLKQREIAERFGVELSNVARIQLRQRYGHVVD